MVTLDYPAWLRIDHWLHVLFLTLLIRSGIEILATHPKLYWRNDSRPGTEWAKFTRKTMPNDKLFDTLDEEESYSPLISLPGRHNLGMGRHWHFISLLGWILTGASYIVLLAVTGQWHRYIPYSWSIFPTAWNDLLTYLSFDLPPLLPGQPLDTLQKLAYAFVVFLLAPFQLLTGAAQSPGVEARFPRFVRLFGGRQGARSLHFLGLVAFIGFVAVHLIMVGLWGWGQLNALMIFGDARAIGWAVTCSLLIVGAIVIIHILATRAGLRHQRAVQNLLGKTITAMRNVLLHPLHSNQSYAEHKISPEHRVNGKPPDTDLYKMMAAHRFAEYCLEVGGLVAAPRHFTLDELRELAHPHDQTVLHNCIQGWSSIGKWGGVPLRYLVDAVEPLPEARYMCFLTMQDSGRDEPSAPGAGQFYEVIDLRLADHAQTILAYEMNDEPLPIKHGAPLRLRVETQVGFKMTKWVNRIEFVAEYDNIGEGTGGWREDNAFYDKNVEI